MFRSYMTDANRSSELGSLRTGFEDQSVAGKERGQPPIQVSHNGSFVIRQHPGLGSHVAPERQFKKTGNCMLLGRALDNRYWSFAD
jgi:hypothetical protein